MHNFVIDTSETGDIELKRLAPREFANLPRGGDYGNYMDRWRTQKVPSDVELVREYKRIAYSCANLNANAVAQVPIRLYVKSKKNDRKARCTTKRVSNKTIDYHCKQTYLNKYLANFAEVEEVVEHPALDALDKVNMFPGFNGHSLRVLTQLYQEIVGRAYWNIINDPVFGMPLTIFLVPSQFMQPYSSPESTEMLDYYLFNANGPNEKKYSVEEIMPFLMPNLKNPYLDGLSPLMAAFEMNEVSNKLVNHESSFLENEARPDMMLTPDKENPIDLEDAIRMEKRFQRRFSRGGAGKFFVNEEHLELTPLQFPPRDLARLEINKWGKVEIANAFDTPLAFFEGIGITRATLEAAREQHALNGVKPRLERYTCNLNEDFLPRFDDSGRLFFAYDDPVPEQKELKLKENVELVMGGIKKPNEARDEYNLPPDPAGDKLTPINVSPGNNPKSGDSKDNNATRNS